MQFRGGENFVMLDMIKLELRAFREDETGTVTADFVVLVSTIVLLGAAVVGAFDDQVVEGSNDVVDAIAAVEVQP